MLFCGHVSLLERVIQTLRLKFGAMGVGEAGVNTEKTDLLFTAAKKEKKVYLSCGSSNSNHGYFITWLNGPFL